MRTPRVLAAVALAVVAAASYAMPAQADCPNPQVDLPSRVSIDRPYKQVTVPLTQACGLSYVSSDLYGPDGWQDIYSYDPSYDGAVDYMDVYDWDMRAGTYYLRDGSGYDADYNEYPVTPDSTVVKYGTTLAIATYRYGSYVKVNIAARRYSPDQDRMIPYTGIVVGLRQRVPGSTAWSTKTYLKTNSGGYASVTFSAPATRYYQAWFGPTNTFWESYSAQSAR